MQQLVTNKKKIIRTVIQIVVLVAIIGAVSFNFLTKPVYEPYTDKFSAATTDNGFIALSYFTVDQYGSKDTISQKQLDEQLGALKAHGYVTITQEDIKSYYKGEKLLPEKALFLMFEDGSRNTALYAQKILEKYNYVATMVTYGENLMKAGSELLLGNDLKDLHKSTFWELGINGYRLSYINVYDRYQNYLGELTSEEYFQMGPYINEDYNHYLMDYIRESDRIAIETNSEMSKRIENDYLLMEKTYRKSIDYLPELYVLMHSNSDSYGSDSQVSAENERHIKDMFSINFNREGLALNKKEINNNIYDLTRLQPKNYWSTNQLLMHISEETGQEIMWQLGDEEQLDNWNIESGAANFSREKITLTSLRKKSGELHFLSDNSIQNLSISTILTGNKYGCQFFDLRVNEDYSSFVRIEIINNYLKIWQKLKEEEQEMLFTLNLDEHDGITYKTIGEDREDSLEAAKKIKKGQITIAETNSENDSLEYIPEIKRNDTAKRNINIQLANDSLTVMIDGKQAAEVKINVFDAGEIYLGSVWGGKDIEDNNNRINTIYDAVFENLYIEETKDDSITLLYDNTLNKFETFMEYLYAFWRIIRNIS